MRHPLYLVEQGSRLSRERRRLVVSKEGTVLARVPVLQVSQVIVFGNVDITTPTLKLLLNEGIDVVLLSVRGRFYGRLVGPPGGHGALRVAQVLRSQEETFALEVARPIVQAKIHNMRAFLQRYQRRRAELDLSAAIQGLAEMSARSERCTTLNSLSGVEGRATAVYFGAWRHLVKPPWRFERRARRPPPDPVNVLLSLGYTLLMHNVWGAALTAGLDPYVGFLHRLDYNRPSLALDLMEVFRPLIVDSVVLRCLNNGIVRPEDFRPGEEAERPVVLEAEGLRRFIREMEHRFTQEFKHPETGERVTYRRLFLLQAYGLARSLTQEGERYRPFRVR